MYYILYIYILYTHTHYIHIYTHIHTWVITYNYSSLLMNRWSAGDSFKDLQFPGGLLLPGPHGGIKLMESDVCVLAGWSWGSMGKVRKFVVRGKFFRSFWGYLWAGPAVTCGSPMNMAVFFGVQRTQGTFMEFPKHQAPKKVSCNVNAQGEFYPSRWIAHGSNASFAFTWSTSFLSTQVPPHIFPVGNPQDELKKPSSYMVAMAQNVPHFFWILTLYDNDTTTARNTPEIGWCTKTDRAKNLFFLVSIFFSARLAVQLSTQAPSWHPTTVTWRPPWSTWRSWPCIAGAGWTGTMACRGRSSLERRPGRSPLELLRSSSAPWILELKSHSGSENWGISMMFWEVRHHWKLFLFWMESFVFW